MRILKLPLAGLLFCVMALFAGCKTSNEPKAPVALTWEWVQVTSNPDIMRIPLFSRISLKNL